MNTTKQKTKQVVAHKKKKTKTKKSESVKSGAKNPSKSSPLPSTWSKSKKKRIRAIKAKQKKGQNNSDEQHVEEKKEEQQPTATDTPKRKSTLQQSFQDRLKSSRFRSLNEDLYTTSSQASFTRFQANPTLFDEYHVGFRQAVSAWPVNPVDVIGKKILKMKKNKVVVADFGCGDAQLAKLLSSSSSSTFTVHSFDLVSTNPLVTACDMTKVPLQDASVDVGVFCLSLMGTNLADCIREAHRVLRQDGVVHVAEVQSRFESMQEFIKVLDRLGFSCTKMDASNKMFVLLELVKNGKKPKRDLQFTAKPCIYKRR